MSMSLFWLAALVLFGLAEAVTVGLTSIWFAAGALAALLATALNASVLIQIVVFLAVSFAALLLVRPLAQRFINDRHVATNADRVIGQEGVVTEAIDNLSARGQVNVSGALWTARSQGDAPIPKGAVVRVLRIEGVKLYVVPAGSPASVPDGEP